ncbi:MAG: hypothetical protein RL742_701 [Bacteroidota bacterium]|jgi:hypothetical protein
MKFTNLDDLRDVAAMSYVLHQMLHALRRSHLQLSAAELSDMLALHKSEISRMRLLHCRPQYLRGVQKNSLYRVVRHLQLQFPTFVIYRRKDGRLLVRLRKRLGEHRIPASRRLISVLPPPLKRDIRPGTTKWFLLQPV